MRFSLPAMALAACVFVPACNGPPASTPSATPLSRYTSANYDRVEVGMALGEVEAMLGKPWATGSHDVKQPDGSARREIDFATWGSHGMYVQDGGGKSVDEERWISVEVADGKVTKKDQKGLE